jgi:Serine/threonine protein phosphatase
MEDMFSVAYQQTEDEKDLEYAFFGIFDGHGGREAATFAKEHLMDYIVNQKGFWSDKDEDILRAIRDGFLQTHLSMWGQLGEWAVRCRLQYLGYVRHQCLTFILKAVFLEH